MHKGEGEEGEGKNMNVCTCPSVCMAGCAHRFVWEGVLHCSETQPKSPPESFR